jgi:hypothetical protein
MNSSGCSGRNVTHETLQGSHGSAFTTSFCGVTLRAIEKKLRNSVAVYLPSGPDLKETLISLILRPTATDYLSHLRAHPSTGSSSERAALCISSRSERRHSKSCAGWSLIPAKMTTV